MKEFIIRVCDNGMASDVVTELVRCKNCMYSASDMVCTHDHEWGNEVSRNHDDPEFYCADGVKKDG